MPSTTKPPKKSSKPAEIYDILYREHGPQYWWPSRTRLETMVGAVLTQNTAWTQAARAVTRLRKSGLLNYARLANATTHELEPQLVSSGTFRVKARRIKELTRWIGDYLGGKPGGLRKKVLAEARLSLLQTPGIGPETADAILLYAGEQPVFVVDNYTRRIFTRMGELAGREGYEEVRGYFEGSLPVSAPLYNEYHALIVKHAKIYCKKKPLCTACPLKPSCSWGSSQGSSPLGQRPGLTPTTI